MASIPLRTVDDAASPFLTWSGVMPSSSSVYSFAYSDESKKKNKYEPRLVHFDKDEKYFLQSVKISIQIFFPRIQAV
jgi:hypothetical protein